MHQKIEHYIGLIGLVVLICTFIVSILGFFSHIHLLFDLASHFRVHCAIAAFVVLILFLLNRSYWLIFVSTILLIINLTFILPWYFGNQETKSTANIKLFLSNVLANNDDHESFISLIRNENPDIIVVMEVNNSWVSALNLLQDEYRYHALAPREDNFGIGVYSKLPIIKESVKYFRSAGVPSIVLTLETTHENLTLIATHPVPPINNSYFNSRNEQLFSLTQYIKKIRGPLILAGDLNTTMWSWHYKQLEQNGNLQNVRKGFGVNATWPSILSILGIPIDHVLVSNEIQVIDLKVGTSVGSDHLPLIVELNTTTNISSNR